jgi:sterol desaturase/sphingolipid hydroxylase (fatty acid hydroxylase superfamily)
MTEPQPPNRAAARRSDIVPFSNAVLFLVFCLLAGTGLAMEFRLHDSSAMLLGVPKRDWAMVHALTALSVLSLVAFHLWANWPWVRSLLQRLRWQTVLVAALGLAVLAVFLLAPVR